MSVLEIILGIVAALFAGVSIWEFVAFKSFKAKYKAEAEKDKAEADTAKQGALESRITSLEGFVRDQGLLIDDLRKEVLSLTADKIAKERRIVQLEAENKSLKSEVDSLKQEIESSKNKKK